MGIGTKGEMEPGRLLMKYRDKIENREGRYMQIWEGVSSNNCCPVIEG